MIKGDVSCGRIGSFYMLVQSPVCTNLHRECGTAKLYPPFTWIRALRCMPLQPTADPGFGHPEPRAATV